MSVHGEHLLPRVEAALGESAQMDRHMHADPPSAGPPGAELHPLSLGGSLAPGRSTGTGPGHSPRGPQFVCPCQGL